MKEKRDRKWIEDGIREEGELRGNISAYQGMGVSKSETIEKIAGHFHLPKQEAVREAEKYWNIS